MSKRSLLLTFGVLLSAAFLYLTLRRVTFSAVADELRALEIQFIILAIATRGVMFGLATLRSRVFFVDNNALSFAPLFRSHLLAFVVNNVIPFRAGDVARVGYLARIGDAPAAGVVAVVVSERLFETFTLGLVLFAVLPIAGANIDYTWSFVALMSISTLAVVGAPIASRHPALFVGIAERFMRIFGRRAASWVSARVDRFVGGLRSLKSIKRVGAIVICSLAIWATAVINIELIALSMNIDLPWYGPFVFLAVVTLGLIIPSTPGHVGTFHFFAATALVSVGVASAKAASFALVAHAVAIVPFTVLGLPVLWADYFRRSRSRDRSAA